MNDRSAAPIGHETRDLNVRAFAWFALGLVVVCVITAVLVVALYVHLGRSHPSPDSPSRIAFDPHMLAPPPQLQTAPVADYEHFQAAEEAKLNSYGWVDKEAGVIRIPIARAMDLIVGRGLPTRGDGTPDASGITSVQMQERKAAAPKP